MRTRAGTAQGTTLCRICQHAIHPGDPVATNRFGTLHAECGREHHHWNRILARQHLSVLKHGTRTR